MKWFSVRFMTSNGLSAKANSGRKQYGLEILNSNFINSNSNWKVKSYAYC